MAAKTTAKLMRVLKSDNAGFADEWKAICDRRGDTVLDVEREVAKIIADVRSGGDEALFAFIKKFDGAKPRQARGDARGVGRGLRVGRAAPIAPRSARPRCACASSTASASRRAGRCARRAAATSASACARSQRVGIYVPGGKAVYPSTVIMNAVPASVVEVPEIVMATPPRSRRLAPPRGADGGARRRRAPRVQDGRRAGDRGARLRHRERAARRQDRRPGQRLRGRPPSAGVRRGRRSTARPGRPRCWSSPTAARRRPGSRPTCSRRPSTTRWRSAILITPREGARRRACRSSSSKQLKTLERAKIARKSLGRAERDRRREGPRRVASSSPNRYAPEHLVLAVDDAETQLEARPERRRDLPRPLHAGGGRRLPRRPEPRAADGRHGALLLAARRRRLPQAHELRALRAAEAARARLRRDPARGARGAAPATARSVELRLQKIRRARREREARARGGDRALSMRTSARASDRAQDPRDRDPRRARRSTARGEYEVSTGHPVLRPHARVVREARPVRPAAPRQGRSRGRPAPHGRGRRHRARPGASARRSATPRASAATARSVLPMAEAKVEVAVDVSNRPYLVYQVELANDRIGDFDASAHRGLPVRVRAERRARSARRAPLRQEPAPRRRGDLQGRGARAARGARARSARRRHPDGEGSLVEPHALAPRDRARRLRRRQPAQRREGARALRADASS